MLVTNKFSQMYPTFLVLKYFSLIKSVYVFNVRNIQQNNFFLYFSIFIFKFSVRMKNLFIIYII